MNEPLLGLGSWPGVTADYDVAATADGAPALRLRLALDAAAYSPAVASPAGAPPDNISGEAPAWQLAAVQALTAYDVLAAQLPTATIAYASSLLPPGERVLDAALHAAVSAWLFGEGGVRDFLRARSEGDAALPAPPPWTLDAACAPEAGMAQVLELVAGVTLSRPEEPADAGTLEDTPQASRATTPLMPREEGDGFAGFARRIEACLSVPGVCLRRLAASVDGTGGLPGAGRTRLWLVRLGLAGDQGLRLQLAGTGGPLAGDPLVYALRPLYATRQSRADLPFYDYVPGKGIDFGRPGGTATLQAIDAEDWMRKVVGALDTVDASDAPEFAAELQAVRGQLAQALSRLVVPVLADQAPDAAQCAAAQDAFLQQALRGLAAAHASDAVVQFATTVTAGEAMPVPRLHGGLLPGAGSDADAGLTPVNVQLRQTPAGATQPLAFLVTAAGDGGAKPQAVTLDLTFRPQHIQVESSCLFFVLPPDALAGEGPLDLRLGRFEVPIPLRGLPAVPSIVAQEALAQPLQAPGGWPQVARALRWDFRFAWPVGPSQDTMFYTVRFNGGDQGPVAPAAPVAAAATDPLPALFAFVHAHAQLQPALEGTPDPLARRAFVQLVRRVADALSAFVSAAPAGAPAAGAGLRLAPADAAGSVPAAQGAVTLAGLDAVAVQGARAWLSAERNQGLLAGRRTADAFVLRTAAVSTAAVRPATVRIGEPIDLAAVGRDTPVPRPLAAHLDNLLSVLFAGVPAQSQVLQLEVGHAADLAAGLPGIMVPVLQLPPTPFRPKRTASAGASQDELVDRLCNAIAAWFAARQPLPGALVFALTAFASGNTGQAVPLLVLDALTLRDADWSDRPVAR